MGFTQTKDQSGVTVRQGRRAADRRQPPGAQGPGPRRAGPGRAPFLIDFSQTGYIDSSGLGALVSISKRVREQRRELRLRGLNEDLRSLFELTKLDTLFAIADTPQQALSSF